MSESAQPPDVTEIRQLLETAGGDFTAAFDQLVKKAEESAPKKISARSTVEGRKAEWLEVLKNRDEHKKKLLDLKRKMRTYVALATGIDTLITSDGELRKLSEIEQEQLMERYVNGREISEFLEVEKELVRVMVFDHITKENEDLGVEDPANQNGRVVVEEFSKAFCKEGCGRKPPTIKFESDKNGPGLIERLGGLWADVVEVREVPATSEIVFSEEKFMRLATGKPELGLLEILRDCLEIGAQKSPRFIVRDL